MAKRVVKRMLIVVPLVVILAIIGTVVWGWTQWRATPEYWQVVEAEPGSPAMVEVERRADQFEFWIVERLQQVREDDGPWQMVLEQNQINEWIATRLRSWLVNQKMRMPDWLHHPMVAVRPGRIILAGDMRTEMVNKVVSLEYVPRSNARGIVDLRLDHVRGGKLPLPYEQVMDSAAGQIDPDDQQQIEQFQEIRERLKTIPLAHELDDGRRVEVLEVRAEQGKLTLTCRTLRAARTR